MKDSESLLLSKPHLIPFAVLSFLRDWLIRPDRSLHGSGEPVLSPTGRWVSASPMPSWRYECTGAAIGGDIYLVGGLVAPTVYTITRRVEVYNARTNSWRTAVPYPVIIHHPSVVSVGGRLFVVGGNGLRITPYSFVHEYLPEENCWARRADMPTPRGALGVAALGGKIYAVGGGTNKVPRAELEEYDPKKDRWCSLMPMPTPREHLAVAAAGGKIVALGGYKKSLAECLNTNEVYDPKTGRWVKGSPMPLAISGFAAVGLGDSVYIFGGEQGWAVSGEVHEYNVKKDRWSRRKDMPVARYAAAAVVQDKAIHIFGGNIRLMGYIYSMDHDVFIPGSPA